MIKKIYVCDLCSKESKVNVTNEFEVVRLMFSNFPENNQDYIICNKCLGVWHEKKMKVDKIEGIQYTQDNAKVKYVAKNNVFKKFINKLLKKNK